MIFNIILPNRNGTTETEQLATENNIVLIGANGSGKSRFGAWIEQQMQSSVTVHRISAQKALGIPDFAQLKNLEQAQNSLLYGRDDQYGNVSYKLSSRWDNNPTTYLLNDFDKLLSLLFAKSTERDRLHTLQTKTSQIYIPVPDAPIDIIIKIWSEIMPHREISFNDGKVLAKKTGEPEYHGKEMSDGERVTLYLIGQCLCAPENSIVIIDEPEIHLHKALVDKIWNKIEELSQTKFIIYITHDLEFASSRKDALKYWIKSYNGNNSWEWENVPLDDILPESLIIKILGSRKNIIFCEGENGGLDTTIYQLIYPDYNIIPRGGGEKVIEATKALNSNPNIHHLNAVGIIDSDYKEEREKEILLQHNIHTISVAEIESLFCIKPILEIISIHLGLNPEEKVNEVIDFLIEALTNEFDIQVSSKAEKIIEYKLGAFSKESNNEQGLKDGLKTTLSRIDIQTLYNETKNKYQNAIDTRDLNQLLLIYNRKSLPNRISGIFGLNNGQFPQLLVRLLKGTQKEQLVTAIKHYLPQL
jgi:Protein of unknown function (DUF4435)/AAA domain, putative AbiEii toxin, Type IV TA system